MKKFKLLNLKSLIPHSNAAPKQRRPATRLAARLTQAPYDDYEEEPTTKLSTAFIVVFVLHVVAVVGIYAFHSIKSKRGGAEVSGASALAAKEKGGAPSAGDMAAKAQPAPAAPPVSAGGPSPAVAAAGAGAAGAAVGAVVAAGAVHAKTVAAAQAAQAEKSAAERAQAASGPSAVIQPPPGTARTGAPSAGAPPRAVPLQAVAAKPTAPGATAEASSKTYKVLEGDNPVKIAKKLRVNYDELLKVNGIEDPRKLRVGQVLKLPVSKQTGNH